MSRLRPECSSTKKAALPDETAWFLIQAAVKKRRNLIHGRLHFGGWHCAMGAFWHDNPGATVHTELVDEVAAVNDADPNSTPYERWRRVNAWLKFKLKVMAARQT